MHRTSSKVLLGVAAFVLFLVPVAAIAGGGQTFTDVPPDDWAFADVEWLAANGLTNGCGDGTTFCPDGNLTRREMAAFTHRLAEALTPTILTQTGSTYPDPRNNCEVGPYTPEIDQQVTFNGGAYWETSAVDGYGAAKVTSSLNGGAFTAVPGQYWIYDQGSTAGVWLSSPLSGAMLLEAGQTYRFGVDTVEIDIDYGGCELVVTAHHAMPVSVILSGVSAVSASSADGDLNG